MSNEKTWASAPKVRKETRSLYLTPDDWQYLTDIGEDGLPSKAVRVLIAEHRLQAQSTSDNEQG